MDSARVNQGEPMPAVLAAEIQAVRDALAQFKESMNERHDRYEERADAQDKAVSTALSAQEKAVSAALAAQEKAVALAQDAAEKASSKVESTQSVINSSQNEWRATVNDIITKYLSRTEWLGAYATINDKIATLNSWKERLAGGEEGLKQSQEQTHWTVERVLSVIAIITSVVMVVVFKT